MFLDFSLIDSFNSTTISKLIKYLQSNNVNVVPVVQENSNQKYLTLIGNLIDTLEIDKICIRFSNDSGGFLNINTTIETLIKNLGTTPSQVSLLLDFGFVRATNHALVEAFAVMWLTLLQIEAIMKT